MQNCLWDYNTLPHLVEGKAVDKVPLEVVILSAFDGCSGQGVDCGNCLSGYMVNLLGTCTSIEGGTSQSLEVVHLGAVLQAVIPGVCGLFQSGIFFRRCTCETFHMPLLYDIKQSNYAVN